MRPIRIKSAPSHVDSPEIAPWSWRFFGAALSIFATLMLAWSLASPLGSIPDEPAHFIRAAAVVRGEVVAEKHAGVPYATVVVPNYVAHTRLLPCYAGKVTLSAGCSTSLTKGVDKPVITATSAGSNSPTYYALVGLPSLVFSGDFALYAMRFVSLMLCSLLLASVFTALKALRFGPWTFAGAVVAITPMTLFLGGSVNPNALELAASGAVFVAVVALARYGTSLARRTFAGYGVLAVVGALLLTGTRSISLLWLLVAAVAALLIAQPKSLKALFVRPRTWIVIALIGVVAGLALLWFTSPLPPGPATGGPPKDGMTIARVAATMARETFGYWTGWIGYFGWLDQPSPDFVYIVWHLCIGVVLAGGVFVGTGRARLVSAGLAVVAFAIPIVVQSAIYSSQGWIWQGRYLLAVDLLLLLTAGISLDNATSKTPGLSRSPIIMRVFRTGLVLMAVGQFLSFFQTLARYVVGNQPVWSVFRISEWQPPLTWAGVSVLFAGVLVVAIWASWRAIGRYERRPQFDPELTE